MNADRVRPLVVCKQKDDVPIICGDWNADLGTDTDGDSQICGPFGLPRGTRMGKEFANWLEKHQMCTMASYFQKPDHKYGTWQSPRDKRWFQVDHIVVQQRDRKLITDCGSVLRFVKSDHSPVQCWFKARLHKLEKTQSLSVTVL